MSDRITEVFQIRRMTACTCQNPPFFYLNFDTRDLGRNEEYGEVSIEVCKQCGSKWVRYSIEDEQHSRSGRWWRAQILNDEDGLVLTAGNAKEFIERQEWCFAGGSFYEIGVHKMMKPIKVF